MAHRTAKLLVAMTLAAGCQDAPDVGRWNPPADPASTFVGAPGASAQGTDLAPPPAYVFVSDELSAQTPPPAAASFSLFDTSDLYFYVYLRDLAPGAHMIQVELDGPDGYLYQTLAAPLVATYTQVSNNRTALGTRVVLQLPVAGTNISGHGLTGEWVARLWVDGAGPVIEKTFEFYSAAVGD